MIIHEFDLDMIPDNAITTVKVNQYDDDFNLKINLFSRKGGLTIQAGTEVIIRGKKPDGHVFSADCSINGNVVTVVGNQQMTAAAGRAIFELSLRKNGKELNSANFIMKVERAPMDKDTPPSNSVIRELVDALDHTEEILEAAESVEEWLSTIDDTLSQPNKAADAKKTGDEIADLKSAVNKQDLFHEEIPDTTQTYTFSNSSVSQVIHSRNSAAVRTDTFTYGPSSITEVRTLNTGETLTIVTNLLTLETTITYTAA